MTAREAQRRVLDRLARTPSRIVACSGGVDSLLLADLAHEAMPDTTVVAHSVTPAVPAAATERTRRVAGELGWTLRLVTSGEFDDRRYLDNPVDRCFHCKSHLYSELDRVVAELGAGTTVLSGANVDDLGEYRPGLQAASDHHVRHPYVEAGVGKSDIRALARARRREWYDLPAAPCLASRLYTGTSVSPALLRAVEHGEITVRRLTGIAVVRCRIDRDRVRIEVPGPDRDKVTPGVVDEVAAAMRTFAPGLAEVALDPRPYAAGRSFVRIEPPVDPG